MQEGRCTAVCETKRGKGEGGRWNGRWEGGRAKRESMNYEFCHGPRLPDCQTRQT